MNRHQSLVLSFAIALLGCVLAAHGTAGAQDAAPSTVDFDACFAAHGRSQELRIAGELVRAREALAICADAACPSVVRTECATWSTEVGTELPSVRFSARRGRESLTDVRVYADDRLIAETADPSESHDIDPGVYTFRFEHDTYGTVEVPGVVRRGEHGRLFVGELPLPVVADPTPGPVAPPVAAPRPFVIPDSAWATGVGALALFAGAAGLGAAVLVERGQALGSCAPFCESGMVDRLRGELIASDVMWATAAALAITTIVLLFADQPSAAPASDSHVAITPEGVTWW